MYDYIKGKYAGFYKDYVTIENNGIGYKIYVPGSTLTMLPKIDEEILLYIHQIVREDFIGLYGFISREELEMFLQLVNINGVGAKAALSILSIMDVEKLKYAISSNDEKLITRAPGVGKKLAQRIILELKDKLKITAKNTNSSGVEDIFVENNSIYSEALEALLTLGYTERECENVLNNINLNNTLESVIKSALRQLMS
ncbi:Holliday junction branch migration protein RuvA [Clostridium sp. 19966]|uniref:Holliday junction branch migration protein RuvA n=1 Tax=Clostridium sp. 19966 TaxID=2768166 RepID=UPI0028DF7016|nr:Holliday junction branch migration protein RuvA [Clostridium sp. 19966]MDT8717465.1 Holliday junction branch migration protein RuvA [Clostridium sp. 19966]